MTKARKQDILDYDEYCGLCFIGTKHETTIKIDKDLVPVIAKFRWYVNHSTKHCHAFTEGGARVLLHHLIFQLRNPDLVFGQVFCSKGMLDLRSENLFARGANHAS